MEFRNGEFRLAGWAGGSEPPAAGWESVLAVYAGNSETPMLGTYSVEGDALVFRPRFPVAAGIGYHGVFKGGGFVLDPPPQPAPRTHVEHIYPSANVLPANTLRLYIYFSAPMSLGEAWQRIHLLDDNGSAVPDAFLELDQELWDPDHKRLTVLLDPGRIKRGLVPASEAGTPIVEGRHYTLAIDREWRDANSVPMMGGFQKAFMGGSSDRTPPAPERWRIETPKAGTSQPLVVDFPKPMDYALLQRMLEVPGIPGSIATDRDETEWRFTPDTPWKAGAYRLSADGTLEDICGNRLERAFDLDTRRTTPERAARKTIQVPFTVSPRRDRR
jgi:hypothetical protein